MLLEASRGAEAQSAASRFIETHGPDVRENSWIRRVFSFPVVLAALLVVLTVLTVRERFSDPDMWWHLKTGEIIWNTHSIPRVDVFSYTAAGHPWTAQEWLSELTIYGAYRLGGYTGMMLWLCVAASLIVIGGYVLSALYSRNVKVAFLGGLTVWLFGTVGFAIRPHMLGYLLLLGELLVLHLGRTRDARWFFALPPVFALWINCHSSFIFGLIVLGVVQACSFLEFECGLLVSRRWDGNARKALAAAFGLSITALFLNPLGPKLIWYPIGVMFNQPINIGIISEWQQPEFNSGRGFGLLAIAALILIVPLLRREKLHLQELLLTALPFYLAIRHERMMFVFGILAAPVLCRLLGTAWVGYKPERDSPVLSGMMIALAAIPIMLGFPASRDLTAQVQKQNPLKAVEFLRRSGLSGRMLNEYVYGGYLIWAAPDRKVFVDGRADVYEPAAVLGDYARLTRLNGDPRSVLDKYRIDFCLLARSEPLTRVLPLLHGWRTVYSDQQAIVFERE